MVGMFVVNLVNEYSFTKLIILYFISGQDQGSHIVKKSSETESKTNLPGLSES